MTVGVILAAGVGSRLRPMTNDRPKCLVRTAGKTILQYQLDSYIKAGVSDVLIIVGYEGDAVREYCKHIKDINITVVENEIYEDTNNMYSLYLVREFVGGREFVLNNADLAMSPDVVPRLLESDSQNLVAVDVGLFNEESMKVSVTADGTITNISKAIDQFESHGCSIDFYKFSAESSTIFFAEIQKIVEQEKNLKDWTEVAMQRLFQSGVMKFECLDIHGLPWVEIDNYDDLALSDKIFSQLDKSILDYSHFLLDLDGTVFVGSQIIDGIPDAVRKLRETGKSITFLSNNSSRSKAQYVDKLTAADIEASVENIVLSTDSVVSYLRVESVARIFVLGTQSLENHFIESGFTVTTENPEFVVVGYDTELTYEKLQVACKLINASVDYIGTHCDLVCPTPNGPVPDAGLLLEMIERTTGRQPFRIFGKPSPATVSDFCDQNKIDVSDVLVVGDRLYTDIKMANDSGADSLLVLSGDTDRDAVDSGNVQPSYILNSLADIF